MTRVFRNGELQEVILDILKTDAPMNGYAIMQKLAIELDGSWRPSPGAIYPALLGLEDAKLIKSKDNGGVKLYELDTLGQEAAKSIQRLQAVKERTLKHDPRKPTVGEILTDFTKTNPYRTVKLDNADKKVVESLLVDLNEHLDDLFGDNLTSKK